MPVTRKKRHLVAGTDVLDSEPLADEIVDDLDEAEALLKTGD